MSETYDRASVVKIAFEELERARFKKTTGDKIAIRISNEADDPLAVSFDTSTYQKILQAPDRKTKFSYLDAGTFNERVIKIEYSSDTIYPSLVAAKNIAYTLVGTKYILETIDKALEPA
jgi:hypothetical protein